MKHVKISTYHLRMKIILLLMTMQRLFGSFVTSTISTTKENVTTEAPSTTTSSSSSSSNERTKVFTAENIPALKGDCFTVDQRKIYYSGKVNRTISGKACQRWDVQTPHEHSFTKPEFFPDVSVSAAENFCREPNLINGRTPWCYTTEPTVGYEMCGIPQCKEPECFNEINGVGMYFGTAHTTVSGLLCQRWDQQSPHRHSYTDNSKFPEQSLSAAENFCRDPGEKGYPWCFTTNQNIVWMRCAVMMCTDECFTINKGWAVYTGKKRVTETGHLCDRWDKYPYKTEHFPDKSVSAAENFCRDPKRKGFPWCYTVEKSIGWMSCGIDMCKDGQWSVWSRKSTGECSEQCTRRVTLTRNCSNPVHSYTIDLCKGRKTDNITEWCTEDNCETRSEPQELVTVFFVLIFMLCLVIVCYRHRKRVLEQKGMSIFDDVRKRLRFLRKRMDTTAKPYLPRLPKRSSSDNAHDDDEKKKKRTYELQLSTDENLGFSTSAELADDDKPYDSQKLHDVPRLGFSSSIEFINDDDDNNKSPEMITTTTTTTAAPEKKLATEEITIDFSSSFELVDVQKNKEMDTSNEQEGFGSSGSTGEVDTKGPSVGQGNVGGGQPRKPEQNDTFTSSSD